MNNEQKAVLWQAAARDGGPLPHVEYRLHHTSTSLLSDADLLQAIEASVCKTRYYSLSDILH